jgi:hypothetical protein
VLVVGVPAEADVSGDSHLFLATRIADGMFQLAAPALAVGRKVSGPAQQVGETRLRGIGPIRFYNFTSFCRTDSWRRFYRVNFIRDN